MESRWSNRTSDENLHVLQKLEEILHRKEMEITSLESEIYSSQNNLSVVKYIQSTASSSKHKVVDGLRLPNGISKGVTDTEAMKEEERKMLRVMNGRKRLTDSKASSSNEVVKISLGNTSRGKVCSNSQGKQLLQASEVEQLIEQLRILEIETEIMKQEFFECVEESKKLVNEIYQQFQTIHHCIQRENVNGEKPCDRSFIFNPDKVIHVTLADNVLCPNIRQFVFFS